VTMITAATALEACRGHDQDWRQKGCSSRSLLTMTKHNTYFDGKVQSLGFERNGRRATAGVVQPGEFHFDTGGAERMIVVSGELVARLPGGEWKHYPVGTAFEIPGQDRIRYPRRAAGRVRICEFI
jgi:uncharacterized protein YaiE (UPF0345 family)